MKDTAGGLIGCARPRLLGLEGGGTYAEESLYLSEDEELMREGDDANVAGTSVCVCVCLTESESESESERNDERRW